MENTKIILTGSFGVGKSSIFDRIIYEKFSDKYYATIGVRVNERRIQVTDAEISIELWDIAGEVNQNKVPIAYFHDKDIILYVIDLNRPLTFKHLERELNYLRELCPHTLIKVVGNKMDLVSPAIIKQCKEAILPCKVDYIISAKTGKYINSLLESLSMEMV